MAVGLNGLITILYSFPTPASLSLYHQGMSAATPLAPNLSSVVGPLFARMEACMVGVRGDPGHFAVSTNM